MFTIEEQKLIDFGIESGKSKSQISKAISKFRAVNLPTVQTQQQDLSSSRLRDIPSDISETGQALGATFKQTSERIGEAARASQAGEQSQVRGLVQSIGAGFGGAARAIGDVFQGALKLTASPKEEEVAQRLLVGLAKPVVDAPATRAIINRWEDIKENDPQKARDIIGLLGLAEFATELIGFGVSKKTGKQALRVAEAGADVVEDVVTTGTKKVGRFAKQAKEGVEQVTSPVTTKLGEVAGDVGGRAKTNLVARQATKQAIETLPSDTAKSAARNGIDVADVRITINSLSNPKNKTIGRELLESVKKFAAGDRAVDPIEIVGRSITEKLKVLDTKLKDVGIRLGLASEGLGSFTKKQLQPAILERLKKVSGLQGLSVAVNGKLDFTNTALATLLTKSDRAAIQKVWLAAIKDGSGQTKHRLRQELFEVLGGKKKSLSNITDTQERAFEAVRGGLLDVLGKNSKYKTLSTEFATISRPLKEMRKKIKATGDVTEDILDMNSGLLARRLTSTSISRGEVQSLLNNIDELVGTGVNTRELQDLYNVLNNYFDIAPKTGFQGQIKGSIGGDTIISLIKKKLIEVAGQTPEVRQKAIEDLINELTG